mmetsp:Transcript_3402/g.14925  ORF Transcript_3402/g.14925 Transcript_3402/m.14925 type:complete len:215 (+) Transcript_3402:3706-4350(+)
MHGVMSRLGPAGLTSRKSTHMTMMLTRIGRIIWKKNPRRSRRAMIHRLRSISRRSSLRFNHRLELTSITRSSASDSSAPFSSLPRSRSTMARSTSASSTSEGGAATLPSPMDLYRLSLRAGMQPIVVASVPFDLLVTRRSSSRPSSSSSSFSSSESDRLLLAQSLVKSEAHGPIALNSAKEHSVDPSGRTGNGSGAVDFGSWPGRGIASRVRVT